MNNKTNKKVKMMAIVLTSLLLFTCFTTACQPTPEEDVIVNKADAEENIVENEEGDSLSGYEVPEHWTETVEKEDVTINIDADISLPSEGSISVTRYTPLIYTQEDTDNFVAYFAGDKKLYLYPTVFTKEDYQEMLVEAKRGTLVDGEYVVTEGSEEYVKQLEELIETAPTDSSKQYTDATLTYDIDINATPETQDEIIEGGKKFS